MYHGPQSNTPERLYPIRIETGRASLAHPKYRNMMVRAQPEPAFTLASSKAAKAKLSAVEYSLRWSPGSAPARSASRAAACKGLRVADAEPTPSTERPASATRSD